MTAIIGGLNRKQIQKLGATAALILFSVSIAAAHFAPATSYELSIYQSTPLLFWCGIGITLLLSMWLSFNAANKIIRNVGIGTAVASVTSITALPLIRGYFYYGTGDALTHLGFVISILTGTYDFQVTLYPGMHLLAAIITLFSGLSAARALFFLLSTFFLLFCVLASLAAREWYGDDSILPLAIFSSILSIPIITINLPVLQPIPATMAILFLPLPIFLFSRYLRTREKRITVSLPITGIGLFLFHPQYATALFVMMIGMSFVLLVISLVRDRRPISVAYSMFLQGTVLGLFLFMWLKGRPGFRGALAEVFVSIISSFSIGQTVASKASGLQQFGGGLLGIFSKLFFLKALFCLFTAAFLLMSLWRILTRNTDQTRRGVHITSIGFGLIPIAGLVVLYIVAGNPSQYLRYIAFLLIFTTIFGALFLQYKRRWLSNHYSPKIANIAFGIFFVLALTSAVPVMFNSPYLYQPSAHVPRAQMIGYAETFEHRATGLPVASTRTQGFRYRHAVYGREQSVDGIGIPPEGELVPPRSIRRTNDTTTSVEHHFANQSLSKRITQPVYLAITQSDKIIDIRLYNGARWSRGDFRYLETSPHIAKIRSNGQFTLYLIQPSNTSVPQNRSYNVPSESTSSFNATS